jgi:NAD(P) transhydrogenase
MSPRKPSGPPANRFDLAVIGSGPAGHKGAIAAAKLGKRVAVADSRQMLGGVCLHTGTVPSKTLREAVLYLTGLRQRAFYGEAFRERATIHPADLKRRVLEVVSRQQEVVRDQLERNHVQVFDGMARFIDAHTLEVATPSAPVRIEAENVLIACGTRPARRDDVAFEGQLITDTDQLLHLGSGELAQSCIVIGAGIIGLEYASMGAALGMQVTVIEARDRMLDFVDDEIVEALSGHLRENGVAFRFGEQVKSIAAVGTAAVEARLSGGGLVRAQRLLYAVGRQANTDTLGLDAIGLAADDRGRLAVNENFQTAVAHVYAAGDVIGVPALAATSAEQGRIAACHMFGVPAGHRPELLPYGIYTIPEVSMVGATEQALVAKGVACACGRALFAEITRAQIMGDRTGLLKLVFDVRTHQLLGVHIMCDGASELVHIGQAVMAAGGTVEVLRDAVFNYPTLAEAYKVAAFDGLNRLAAAGAAATASRRREQHA